jgi:acetyltransferase
MVGGQPCFHSISNTKIAAIMQDGKEIEIEVARYGINPDGDSCEFVIVVADEWLGKGIGARLLMMLMEAANAKGNKMMEGEVLAENGAMLSLVKRLGLSVSVLSDEPAIFAVQRTR